MRKHQPRIVIFSNPEFTSGGAVALHLLCALLVRRGYDAKIFLWGASKREKDSQLKFLVRGFYLTYLYFLKRLLYRYCNFKNVVGRSRRFKLYANEVFRNPIKYWPWVSKETIVVYPEIISGNPLYARRVVRWLLHRPGYHTNEICFGVEDLFFAYHQVFNDEQFNPTSRRLTLAYVNLDLCKQTNFGERRGTCYILRKGKTRDDLPTCFDGPIIDQLSAQEIVQVFNTCEYCVSYDTMTFYSYMASVCGCISVIVPQRGVTKEAWRAQEHLRYGIAYGFAEQEIRCAVQTRKLLVERLENIQVENDRNVDYFLSECAHYWGTTKQQ